MDCETPNCYNKKQMEYNEIEMSEKKKMELNKRLPDQTLGSLFEFQNDII